MAKNYVLEQMEKAKLSFLKARNEEFKGEKYYRVILAYIPDTEYLGMCDAIDYISIEHYRGVTVKKPNIFGNMVTRTVRKNVQERIGVYAIKDKYGIREMVTGRLLVPYDEDGQIHCCGLVAIEDMAKAGEDLGFLENDEECKKQYFSKLLEISRDLRTRWEGYNIGEHTKEQSIQYFKSYRPPQQ